MVISSTSVRNELNERDIREETNILNALRVGWRCCDQVSLGSTSLALGIALGAPLNSPNIFLNNKYASNNFLDSLPATLILRLGENCKVLQL